MEDSRKYQIKKQIKLIEKINWKFDQLMTEVLSELDEIEYNKLKTNWIEILNSNVDRYEDI